MHGFWDKVFFSIFCIPFSVIVGPLVCWVLSHYFQGIEGFGVYLLSVVVALVFTTILSFLFPAFVSKILAAII